jgi:biopolymer transport protein ExbB/TolQ
VVHVIEALAPVLLFIEKAIFAILIFLEAAIVAIFAWKLGAFAKARGNAPKWMELLSKGLRVGAGAPFEVAEKDAATLPGRTVKTGLENAGLAPEALEKVFDAQESIEKRGLDQGLPFLGTVGANAPFLGLTGTVIGILVAFDRFAASGGRGSTEVMVSISRALVATALGLLVAIPAVVFYNVLRNRVKTLLDESREIRSLLLARSLQATFSKPEA